MLATLGTILGSTGVIERGMKLIDDAWTTDAERTEARAKAKVELMKAYAPFKVAQRYLALMFGATYLTSYAAVIVMTLGGWGNPEAITAVMGEFNINWIMGTIVLFYFGGGLTESVGRAVGKGRKPDAPVTREAGN